MEPYDWSAIVKALVASGLTQPQIADACGCGQSTLSDLLNRRTIDPRVSLALKLLRLAQSRGLQLLRLDPAQPCPLAEVARQHIESQARDAA